MLKSTSTQDIQSFYLLAAFQRTGQNIKTVPDSQKNLVKTHSYIHNLPKKQKPDTGCIQHLVQDKCQQKRTINKKITEKQVS